MSYVGTQSPWGFDEDDNDEDDDLWADNPPHDPILDAPLKSRDGGPIPPDIQTNAQIIAHSGRFLESRRMRARFDLATVSGIRLHAPPAPQLRNTPSSMGEKRPACLVIEFSSPPPPTAFAARKLGPRLPVEVTFQTVPDWTPGGIASRASR
jgi:hypothetical protein